VAAPTRIIFISALTAATLLGGTRAADAQIGVSVHVPFVGFGFYSSPYGYPVYAMPAQWGPYPYPYPYPFHPPADPGGAIRLEVKPKQAEVYVDGYYAGVVDDFDGTFQRLRVPPGEHTITLYMDGYHSVTQKIYLEPDNTFRIKYTMEKLGASDQPDPRPVQPSGPPPGAMPPQAGAPPQPGEPRPMPPARRGPPPRPAPPQGNPNAPPPGAAVGYGTLTIRVQPADAEILIDGQPWRRPSSNDALVVDVAEGRHAIDIRKNGYIGYVTEVQVRPGETTPLNVSLRTQNDR
jgi:hypothetical protein